MSTHTGEFAFEATVESMLLDGGWRKGDLGEWAVDRALFPARALAFICDTQPDLWAGMTTLHGASLESTLIETLVKELDNKGAMDVLRHGFRFYGKTFRVAYFKPSHGLNPDALAQFKRNELTVTRQARCHPGKGHEVDLLFALNGVPVATCELKNPMTGQTWRSAVRQYQQERDPNVPLFRFQKRALVHFAADPEEVHMTTRLASEATRFLPFNRGSAPGAIGCGAGNPPDPSGYRTGYFWQEVLERERFLDILGSYVFVEHREEKVEDAKGTRTEKRETVIFPRYHQLDSVSKLVAAARADGPGRNYLIQHSAGSGKTNSISWLSHRLASLHTAADEKVYHCVIVITDRRVLDQQLQAAIYQIEHAQGVVKAIDQDSQQLARALVDGTMIVITTLQKFPFVLKGLLTIAGAAPSENPSEAEQAQAAAWQREIAGRRYAVIVDEAHSSQTGETAREMKAILGVRAQDARQENEDWQDGLAAVVESRGRQPNLSFFAFHGHPQGQDRRAVRPAGSQRQAGVLSRLQHAAGDRGGIHPRRAPELHRLQHVLPPGEAGRGRPGFPETPHSRRAGQVHDPPSLQHRAEDRGHRRALPRTRAPANRRPREGHGRDLLAASRRALPAGVQALHRRARVRRTSAPWWPSAEPSPIRIRARSSRSPA